MRSYYNNHVLPATFEYTNSELSFNTINFFLEYVDWNSEFVLGGVFLFNYCFVDIR